MHTRSDAAYRSEQTRESGGGRRNARGAHDSRRRGSRRRRQGNHSGAHRRRRTSPAYKRSHASNERHPKKQALGVPASLVIVLVLLSVAASSLVTFFVLKPRIETAEREAVAAKEETKAVRSQITTLTSELQRQAEAAAEAQEALAAKNGSSNSSKDKKDQNGAEGVDDSWLESGSYTTGDKILDTEVKAYCDSIADPSMGLENGAFEVYKAIAWSDYVERENAQHPSGADWRIVYARQFYENGCSGNCYEFAAFLAYCFQYLGLSDAHAEGALIQLESGSWGDHGLVYLTYTDGSACLCDTALGTDGWMLSAGAYNVQIQDFENA